MERQNKDLRIIKLLLIGESSVGKTSIMFRFSDGMFSYSNIPTIGIDFKIKTVEIDGKKVKLQIWDTSGQERFDAITRQYYRGAMGIILVYDITFAKSFARTEKWIRNIQENAGNDVKKVLLGNKCDMENNRVISKTDGENLAMDYGMKFYETSAKANINIDEAIMELSECIYQQYTQELIQANCHTQKQSSDTRFPALNFRSTKSQTCCNI